VFFESEFAERKGLRKTVMMMRKSAEIIVAKAAAAVIESE